ncbi:tetr bacterial regulatory protein hth signature [Lucifera butyrica]|uniref:Tetr bacterial regulatory protein hth signature n=1 Tax=Lucifera butyrica TaxID=1351585 RepID=A0A498R2H5_9FIRM|nr:TetR/AcrR family transcriptional regulator [Lucifera butyrica]VBB04970.1 tetr bacterial regulatory protein hth signature [Lucifera butyrica]
MQEKIQDKKAAVLQATLELISEQGFHATPMSQIAQKANIGVGTIYRYFPSKEDLINSLYIQVKSRLAQFVFKNYSENMPVRRSFIILLRSIVDYFIENPKEFLFMEQYANSPMITVATRQEGLRMFEPASKLFIRAKEETLLKDLPMEMINTLAFGATKALVNLYLFSEVKPDSATLDKGVEAVWDTIRR